MLETRTKWLPKYTESWFNSWSNNFFRTSNIIIYNCSKENGINYQLYSLSRNSIPDISKELWIDSNINITTLKIVQVGSKISPPSVSNVSNVESKLKEGDLLRQTRKS